MKKKKISFSYILKNNIHLYIKGFKNKPPCLIYYRKPFRIIYEGIYSRVFPPIAPKPTAKEMPHKLHMQGQQMFLIQSLAFLPLGSNRLLFLQGDPKTRKQIEALPQGTCGQSGPAGRVVRISGKSEIFLARGSTGRRKRVGFWCPLCSLVLALVLHGFFFLLFLLSSIAEVICCASPSSGKASSSSLMRGRRL